MIFIFKDNINAVSKEIVKVDLPNGYWLFKLGSLLAERGISKNKIMRDTNTKHDTLQGYVNGTLKRVDIDVLDRFCNYLSCDMIDIIEYIKGFVKKSV